MATGFVIAVGCAGCATATGTSQSAAGDQEVAGGAYVLTVDPCALPAPKVDEAISDAVAFLRRTSDPETRQLAAQAANEMRACDLASEADRLDEALAE